MLLRYSRGYFGIYSISKQFDVMPLWETTNKKYKYQTTCSGNGCLNGMPLTHIKRQYLKLNRPEYSSHQAP